MLIRVKFHLLVFHLALYGIPFPYTISENLYTSASRQVQNYLFMNLSIRLLIYSLLTYLAANQSAQPKKDVEKELINEKNPQIPSLSLVHKASLNDSRIVAMRDVSDIEMKVIRQPSIFLLVFKDAEYTLLEAQLQEPVLKQNIFPQDLQWKTRMRFQDSLVRCYDFFRISLQQDSYQYTFLCSQAQMVVQVSCSDMACSKTQISREKTQISSIQAFFQYPKCFLAIVNESIIRKLVVPVDSNYSSCIDYEGNLNELSKYCNNTLELQLIIRQENIFVKISNKIYDLASSTPFLASEFLVSIDGNQGPISYLPQIETYTLLSSKVNIGFHPTHRFLFYDDEPLLYNETITWFDGCLYQIETSKILIMKSVGLVATAFQDQLSLFEINQFRNYRPLASIGYEKIIHESQGILERPGKQSIYIPYSSLGIFDQVFLPENDPFILSVTHFKQDDIFCASSAGFIYTTLNAASKAWIVQHFDGASLWIEELFCAQHQAFRTPSRAQTDIILSDSLVAVVNSHFYYVCESYTSIRRLGSGFFISFSKKIEKISKQSLNLLKVEFADDSLILSTSFLKPDPSACQNLVLDHFCVSSLEHSIKIINIDYQILVNEFEFPHKIQKLYTNQQRDIIILFNVNGSDSLIQYLFSNKQIYRIKELPLLGAKLDTSEDFYLWKETFSVLAHYGPQRIQLLYNLSLPSYDCLIGVWNLSDDSLVYFQSLPLEINYRINFSYYSQMSLSVFKVELNIDEGFQDKVLTFPTYFSQKNLTVIYKIALVEKFTLLTPLKSPTLQALVNPEGFVRLHLFKLVRGQIVDVRSFHSLIRPIQNLTHNYASLHLYGAFTSKGIFLCSPDILLLIKDDDLMVYDFTTLKWKTIWKFNQAIRARFHTQTIQGKRYCLLYGVNTQIFDIQIYMVDIQRIELIQGAPLIDENVNTTKFVKKILGFESKIIILHDDRMSIYEIIIGQNQLFKLELEKIIKAEYSSIDIVDCFLIASKLYDQEVLLEVFDLSCPPQNIHLCLLFSESVDSRHLFAEGAEFWQASFMKTFQVINCTRVSQNLDLQILHIHNQDLIYSIVQLSNSSKQSSNTIPTKILFRSVIRKKQSTTFKFLKIQNNILYCLEQEFDQVKLSAYLIDQHQKDQFKYQEIQFFECRKLFIDFKFGMCVLICLPNTLQYFNQISIFQLNPDYLAQVRQNQKSLLIEIQGSEHQVVSYKIKLIHLYQSQLRFLVIFLTYCSLFFFLNQQGAQGRKRNKFQMLSS